MPRVVLDTNVLIADAYNPGSSSAAIVTACLEGRVVPVVSRAVLDEYEFILPRAIHGRPWHERYEALMKLAQVAEPSEVPAVVAADPSDDRLFAAALAGRAEAIVTNDAQVLQVERYEGVVVLTPRRFAEMLERPEPPTAQPERFNAR